MRGILDMDILCMSKIFKFMKPLDLCSMRDCNRQLRDSVDSHFRLLYFVREEWLEITEENIENVEKILKIFGKYVRYLKVREREATRGQNLLLNAILTNCGAMLKGLSLDSLKLYDFDTEKLAPVFDNLEILELTKCDGDQTCIKNLLLGHKYPNLRTLNIKDLEVKKNVLTKFFTRKRNITKLSCRWLNIDVLPFIIRNAAGIEELCFGFQLEQTTNLTSLAQLRKLKQLAIVCYFGDQKPIIALIKALSIHNKLEKFGICGFEFTDEFCKALTNLTNLKELRLSVGRGTINDTKSVDLLGRKLSKLESLTLANVNAPYRNLLASFCKSDKFQTFYFHYSLVNEIKSFIKQTLQDFIEGRGDRRFVSGEPLFIYIHEDRFRELKELLRPVDLRSIEKYGNIKIRLSKRYCFYK